ncbi:tRNA(Ile)-lysidine synthetase, MesJ [Levilactobacillus senmaizukei DSM 21775 = NBRC 103853]|uniref:tRNA(Ile)-lysidine synthase n=1 Tax=Levilactobacillus senmaizukei DSM 21775 = NBRC 103853 TaxID=1423803 RepID=A0A0R2DC93_9LACO|nr:tRNA lysidine(34) synthetase TilS [Levilactobacillus senmaizukei]KRN01506.1 tRNA(Ile)-lysidine synthetase, MesJ [Levilactobacillus senmaizukei DSM 21775 = NBRC 103853]
MTLTERFREICQANGWNDPKQSGLVAVSTGIDSMVLLSLFLRLPVQERPQLTVVHVNHQLREQSAVEQAFLTDWCRQRRVPLVVRAWPVADHPLHGTEAAARAFRYRFFEDELAKRSANWVATAHQADEQVETILLKLIRGGQLDQLTGMAASRPLGVGQLIRPLLSFTKRELKTFAVAEGLPWYEDATNQELVASRNRIRQVILPQLREENPQVERHILGYAEQLQMILDLARPQVVTATAQVCISTAPITGSVERLLGQSEVNQTSILMKLLKQANPELSTEKSLLIQVQQLLSNSQRPTGMVQLGQGWVLEKRYQIFKVWRPKKSGEKSVEQFRFMVDLNHYHAIGCGRQLGLFEATASQREAVTQTVTLTPDQLPLQVRPWNQTDVLRLRNGHHQSVRRALINAKIPRDQRAQVSVLVTAKQEVLAALGVKWSVWPRQSHATAYHLILKRDEMKGEQHE